MNKSDVGKRKTALHTLSLNLKVIRHTASLDLLKHPETSKRQGILAAPFRPSALFWHFLLHFKELNSYVVDFKVFTAFNVFNWGKMSSPNRFRQI